MYNNLVYRHKDIDVGDYLNALSRNITDLKNIKENNNQVKLEDIENAFNNTLRTSNLSQKTSNLTVAIPTKNSENFYLNVLSLLSHVDK